MGVENKASILPSLLAPNLNSRLPMKKPRLTVLLNLTTAWGWYIYNNAERKFLGWSLFSAWGVSIVERFVYHNPIEKPTPLTYVYPALALLAFAVDGYLEAKKINEKASSTIAWKILDAIKFKK